MKVRPRPTLSMPSVATKGGTASRATSTPLIEPSAVPVATPARMPTSGWWALMPVTRLPATIPEMASSEPTERSMPPQSTTKVIPMARMPLMEVCRRTLAQLPQVRKNSLAKVRTTQRTKKTTMMP